MEQESKSRVETAVPTPDAAKQLSEEERQDLQRSGDIEHAHGEQREEIAKRAAAE